MRGSCIPTDNIRGSSATEERLLQVLKALATSAKRALSISALAQKAGYSELKELRRDLKTLKERGLVEIYWSGFPSDRKAHRRIAVLAADLITVDTSTIEDEENETTELCISLPTTSHISAAFANLKASLSLPYSVHILIWRYVELVLHRELQAAERILDKIKRRLPTGEFFEGVQFGLEGFQNSIVNDTSSPTFFNSLNENCDLQQIRRNFMDEVKKSSHALYDRGYFYALTLCTRVMIKNAELTGKLFSKPMPNMPSKSPQEASLEEEFFE
jgi:hypothetical protein